jgi:hypothetical protein
MYLCSSFAMSTHECKFKSLKLGLLYNAIMAQTLRDHGQGLILFAEAGSKIASVLEVYLHLAATS